jgi:hypothetical protein
MWENQFIQKAMLAIGQNSAVAQLIKDPNLKILVNLLVSCSREFFAVTSEVEKVMLTGKAQGIIAAIIEIGNIAQNPEYSAVLNKLGAAQEKVAIVSLPQAQYRLNLKIEGLSSKQISL